jgi:hypothetical protein
MSMELSFVIRKLISIVRRLIRSDTLPPNSLALILTCRGDTSRLSCLTLRFGALPLSYSTYCLTVLGQAVNRIRKEHHKKTKGLKGESQEAGREVGWKPDDIASPTVAKSTWGRRL